MGRAIQKIRSFFIGWFHVLTFKESEEAKRRIGICRKCPSNKRKLRWFGSWFVSVCIECGCPIIAKSRSVDECPLNKW